MKNKLLVIAFVIVGSASIAYAAYSQALNINGTGTATGNFNVAISAITPISKTGATDATAPSFNATSATFNVNLAYPGASAVYDITVSNTGSIPAKLTSITSLTSINAAAPTYINYAYSGVTAGTTTIAATTGTNVVRVTVTWDSASSPNTTSGNTKSATITLSYDQDT